MDDCPHCFAGGGEVKGVHRSRDDADEINYGRPGESVAGSEIRTNYTPATKYKLDPADKRQNKDTLGKVKDEHYKVLGQITAMKGKNREYLADGGSVAEPDPKKAKEMQAGATSGGTTLSQGWKNLKDGLGMADGGEVPTMEEEESEEDMELQGLACDELMEAIAKKDRAGVLEAIRAIVLSVR